MPDKKLKITQSLLSSWQWIAKSDAKYADKAYRDFIKTLNRVPSAPNKFMQAGIDFENRVAEYANGTDIPETHEWAGGVKKIGSLLEGARFQVDAYKELTVDGTAFLLHGRLDALKAETIYDIKFTAGSYKPGHFLRGTQHAFYLEIVPEADRFIYLVSDGSEVYFEKYDRGSSPPIENAIREFISFLKMADLYEIYAAKWTRETTDRI
ncbi:MAG: hypothetical protein FWF03_06520 [Defluviitaleaceae bacterium]|nr:hypothetical protein [Defluviitaleaceae bacterium]